MVVHYKESMLLDLPVICWLIDLDLSSGSENWRLTAVPEGSESEGSGSMFEVWVVWVKHPGVCLAINDSCEKSDCFLRQ